MLWRGQTHLACSPNRGRGASALAHRLLATAAVTARPMEDGLFSTQLGSAGPRVAFLHGLFGQGKNWTTIAKGLSDSARVSLVDLPNHGRSPWTDHFSYAEMAELGCRASPSPGRS